jgi:hypothetical protein
MFQRLLATYRGLTIVNVGAGESTSFRHDSWSTVGPLAMAILTLFSHCVDPVVSVAGALCTGELVLPLRDRLSSATAADLAALSAKLAGLRLGHAPDTRGLRWGAEKTFCAGAIYRMLKHTDCSVPLAEANWGNFAPVKVRVFFGSSAMATRGRAASSTATASSTSTTAPTASTRLRTSATSSSGAPRAAAFWAHACPGAPPPQTFEDLWERVPPPPVAQHCRAPPPLGRMEEPQ